MSTSIRLSPAELKELIGSSRKKAQIEWLSYRGWRFDLDVNDRPIVMRSFVEHRLGIPSKVTGDRESRPHFELLASA